MLRETDLLMQSCSRDDLLQLPHRKTQRSEKTATYTAGSITEHEQTSQDRRHTQAHLSHWVPEPTSPFHLPIPRVFIFFELVVPPDPEARGAFAVNPHKDGALHGDRQVHEPWARWRLELYLMHRVTELVVRQYACEISTRET